MFNILKQIFFKYFLRVLLFLFVFYVAVRPAQTALNQKVIAPIITEKLNDIGPHLSLHTNKNHAAIHFSIDEKGKKKVLGFSMPFGQFYFFLIFFFWFKPPLLIKALSVYNMMLIPAYIFAVFIFLRGYGIFGYTLIMHEKIFRLIYFFIFSLKILRPKQFKAIFSG